MYNVQNVHSTCWLYQVKAILWDTVTLIIPLAFPFLLTETSH